MISKKEFLLFLLFCLLPSCKHVESAQHISRLELQTRVIGTWRFDNGMHEGPFYGVVFSPNGEWTAKTIVKEKSKIVHEYWRVLNNGILLITKNKGGWPQTNDEIFVPKNISENEMIFEHPSVGGELTFEKE